MAECITEGCSNEALFTTTCAFCSMGKLPSAREIESYIPKPRVVEPYVTWMGSIQNQFNEREEKTALKIAGSASDGDGGLTTVKGVRVHHMTTPRANYSVWFVRNVSGVNITVYGLGTHKGRGNKRYAVQWYDGSTVEVNL